ncbi:MAG: urease accessory protein UreD [Roseobacter sp.]
MRAATPLDQPRAIGAAAVSSKAGPYGSCIDGLRQSGALKMLFPQGRDALEAIVINTAGGVTGGDNFTIDATSGDDSHLSLTTQAAERGYKAQSGQIGCIRTTLRAKSGSTLFWLPQETILYDGARINRTLSVDLEPSARFLMVEPILFGRRAMSEDVHDITFHDRIDIRQAGVPIYKDGINLTGNVARQLDRPAIANGARAIASVLCVMPNASGQLAPLRDLLGDAGGVSLLREDLLTLRLLAEDGFYLRQALLPVLDHLSNNSLPLSWRL